MRQQGRFDAVLCDIDGCLAPESGGPFDLVGLEQVARHNREAIRTGDGPVVTLCSGRPIPFVEAMSRAIANTVLPAIGEMGVWLYDPKTHLMEPDPNITPDQSRAIAEAAKWVRAEFSVHEVFQQPGKTCSISLYHEDTAYLMGLAPILREHFEEQGWPIRVSNTMLWINCDLESVSKGTGIDRFIRKTGIVPERLAAIGDTMGDMAMRERVGWFGCPANAVEDLKPHADALSEKQEVQGVLDLLEQLQSG